MVGWPLVYGALLTAVGVGGFVTTGAQHKTALIPAGFGGVALGLGLLGRRQGLERVAVQGTVALGLLGLLGSGRGLARLPTLMRGGAVERPAAVVSQSLMAGLSAASVLLGLRALAGGR